VTSILGIDLGERRMGVAIADSDGGRAMPLATLKRRANDNPERRVDADARLLATLVEEHAASEIVVGLPLEASGAEGPQASLTRAWADAIGTTLPVPITLRDERLTSHLAEQRVGPMKRGRSGGPPTRTQREAYRARIDREAAAIILQDELDARHAAAGDRHSPGKSR